MGGRVEILHTEPNATRRDSRGELAMVVVIGSYDSDGSRVHAAAPSHETAEPKAAPSVLSREDLPAAIY